MLGGGWDGGRRFGDGFGEVGVVVVVVVVLSVHRSGEGG